MQSNSQHGLTYFEAYGLAAGLSTDATLVAGRYAFQRDAEANIADDVSRKLELCPTDRLLDIGCGPGAILRRLGPQVAEATGLDHPACLAHLRSQVAATGNISLIEGEWPGTRLHNTYHKILAYSVVHYLADRKAAFAFIDACLEILRPGGMLLIGDMPNRDSKDRAMATPAGKHLADEWAEAVKHADARGQAAIQQVFAQVQQTRLLIDDAFVMEVLLHYRKQGYGVFVLPQPNTLPFFRTREDLLICKYP